MSAPEQLSLVAPEPGSGPSVPGGVDPPHPPTPEQAAVIDARDRDVFLEAGAGTGKTRVLVSRYCDAIDLDGIEPERILAFTFTERAAAEMRRRVRTELSRRAGQAESPERRTRLLAAARAGEGTPITTIHGFCRRLLAAHPVAAGLDPRFRVLDAEEAARLATRAYEQALADLAGSDPELVATAAGYRWRLAGIVRAAHRDLRNRGFLIPLLPPIQISALERVAEDDPAAPGQIEHAASSYDAIRRLLEAYGNRYEELCRDRSGVDFDHLQLLALGLLRESRTIAEAQRERFDHLLVDEFQDTSPIQVELVTALAGSATRLFVVGDEHQSIYSFRGADLASFRRQRERIRQRADRDPAEAVILPLSGSFRSDPDVVGAVNAIGEALLDDFRPLRVGRLRDGPAPGPANQPAVELLLTRRDGWREPGHRIPTARHDAPPSRVAEARFLAGRLRELADAGVDRTGMVVLLRAFTQVDVYAEALELAGLEPHVIGGRGYWSAQQVGDALRLLACVANPLDDESLLGALASPACGASPNALWILRRIAGSRRHLWPALDRLLSPPPERPEDRPDTEAQIDDAELERRRSAAEWAERLPDEDLERLARFHRRLAGLRRQAALLPLDTLVEQTLQTFDYDLTTLLLEDGRRRTANLMKLVRIATEYEAHDGRDLRGFLDHAVARAGLSDREAEAATGSEQHAGVRVMTVHAAKGLEFETVAVADLGRGLCIGGQPPELRIDFEAEGTAVAAREGPPPARVGLRLARAGAGSVDTEGYGRLNEDAADSEAEESGRLAYVAASRAERRLLLSGTFVDKDLEESGKPRRQRSALACLLPALGVEGTDGQLLEVPAPEPRPGFEARFGPAQIAVRVIGAGSATAARLALDRRRRAAAAPAVVGGRPPLIGRVEGGAAAARSLSYAALADFERCGYRFLAERVIGLGSGTEAATPEAPRGGGDDPADSTPSDWDEPSDRADRGAPEAGGAFEPAAREARMGFGRAVHALLEWSARHDWKLPPKELREALLARERVVPGGSDRARATLEGWLASPLLSELERAPMARFRPEVPFRLALGGETVLRGTIDLLVTAAGEPPTVLDYKTDALHGGVPAALGESYALQRDLYAAAVSEATGAPVLRSVYLFLERPDQPLIETLGGDAIAAGRSRIETLVARIRAGGFEPTPEPHAGLCHDCPARPRLCPHGKELTLRPAQ